MLRSPSDTGHSRYRLLETIRAFARDELARSGQEPSIRQTHAAYFLAAAEEWGDAAGRGPDRTLWLDRLQEELPNLREAVRWTIQEQREDDTRMRWAKAMSSFGFLRDHFAEVYAWNVALGAVPGAGRPSLRRARALVATSVVACTGQIDFAVAGACCEEALPILLANQDALWVIRAYVNLAESLAHRGDYDPAQAASEAALAWSRQVGDRIREAMSLGTLAQIAFARADWSRARSLANASLELANEVGDTFNQGESYRQLGDVARALGELPTARLQYEAGLERAVQLGHRQTQANALFGLGYTYLASKEQARAGSLFIEGLTLARQVGLRLEIAAGLEGLGVLAAYKGQPERALALVGGAAALRETTCAPLSPGARWLLDSSLRPTGVALGDPGTSETLLRVRVMPLEMVFALALDSEPPTEASHIELPGGLTRREREVAGLIGRGLTNRQIAERLVITQRTVAAHIEHILEKLEFRSRLQIGLWWAQHDSDAAGTG